MDDNMQKHEESKNDSSNLDAVNPIVEDSTLNADLEGNPKPTKRGLFISISVGLIIGIGMSLIIINFAYSYAFGSNLYSDIKLLVNSNVSVPKEVTTPISSSNLEPEIIDNAGSNSNQELQDYGDIKEDIKSDLYVNKEYGFSFVLLEGERAIECENDYPELNNVNVSVHVTEREPVSDPDFDECATGGVVESVFVNKIPNFNPVESRIEDLESEGYEYDVRQFEIEVSGIEGVEIVGIRDADLSPAPIPDRIDEVLVENNGMFYIIDEFFLQRDIEIL